MTLLVSFRKILGDSFRSPARDYSIVTFDYDYALNSRRDTIRFVAYSWSLKNSIILSTAFMVIWFSSHPPRHSRSTLKMDVIDKEAINCDSPKLTVTDRSRWWDTFMAFVFHFIMIRRLFDQQTQFVCLRRVCQLAKQSKSSLILNLWRILSPMLKFYSHILINKDREPGNSRWSC